MKKPTLKISQVDTDADMTSVVALAKTIWTEHYTPIIGQDQVDYMLDKFQSQEAIQRQISDGVEYYLMHYHGKTSGYFSIISKSDTLFLSKLYVLSTLRGKGIGKTAIDFIRHRATKLNYNRISLTVNKNNHHTIAAYEKMGFINKGAVVQDIGNGYVMDDYVMELEL